MAPLVPKMLRDAQKEQICRFQGGLGSVRLRLLLEFIKTCPSQIIT
jgi:hypothetical protein